MKSGATTRFLYDGADRIGEYDGSNAVQRRYVHGPGIDNPIAWYEGSAISGTTRRFLMADERGSVVSITDSAGATIHINAYDEYGIPAPGNVGKFGYTGQLWLPEVGCGIIRRASTRRRSGGSCRVIRSGMAMG